MKERSLYKKIANLSDWDLDPGCHRYVNQHTQAKRNLKLKLRRGARKKLGATILKLNINLT